MSCAGGSRRCAHLAMAKTQRTRAPVCRAKSWCRPWAFKAANPGCAFEDFVRFDSPNDWIDAGPSESSGGRLSERMARAGNLWRSLWDETPALPALEQRPLFNAEAEAEKVLHWFDTATPLAALSELLSAGAAAAAQVLAASPAAAVPPSERALIARDSGLVLWLARDRRAVSARANALGDASIAGATSRQIPPCSHRPKGR